MHSACTRIFVLAGAALAMFSVAVAGPVETPKDPAGPSISYSISTDRTGSQLNWPAGQIEVAAQGFAFSKDGAAQARSAAFTILVNEARRAIVTLRVDGQTALNTAVKDAEIKQIAEDMIARLVVAHEAWDEKAGTYTVVGVMPMYGQHGLSYLGAKSMISFKPVELKTDAITITAPVPRGYTPQKFTGPYTGVIVNGDAAMLTPCLFPRIMRIDGRELWGPFTLSPAEVISGPVRYAANLDAALKAQMAGERPLILSAVGNAMNSCYPVVNLDDVYLALTKQKEAQVFNNLPIVITLGYRVLQSGK